MNEKSPFDIDYDSKIWSLTLGILMFRSSSISSLLMKYWAGQCLHADPSISIKICLREFICFRPFLSIEITENPQYIYNNSNSQRIFWIEPFANGYMKFPCEYLKECKDYEYLLVILASLVYEDRRSFTQVNTDIIEHRWSYTNFRFNQQFSGLYNRMVFLVLYIISFYNMVSTGDFNEIKKDQRRSTKSKIIQWFNKQLFKHLPDLEEEAKYNDEEKIIVESIFEILKKRNRKDVSGRLTKLLIKIDKKDDEKMSIVKDKIESHFTKNTESL